MTASQPATPMLDDEAPKSSGNFRWVICALLFAATTINYVDRQTLSQLKPLLQSKLHFDDASYGWMNFAFTAGYAVMYVFAGRFIDWIGVRTGLAIAVGIWSFACMGHSLVTGAIGFAIARFILAMGESANFPAAIKTTAEWFPKKERALATGLFNCGSNVGLMLTPVTAYLAVVLAWQWAFVAIGIMGLLWLAWWLAVYQPPEVHPSLSPAELAYIRQDQGQSVQKIKIPWTVLLRQRQAWPYLIGKFLTDPVWWFFLFWMPSYLSDVRHMSLLSGAAALLIPYSAASVGSIAGGWISSRLIDRGMNVAGARYIAMGICAICMPISIYAIYTHEISISIGLMSLALAAHQGWSANIFTTATDMFPPAVAGSVTGLGGTAGAIGGMLMTLMAGAVIQYTHHYTALFIWAGLMHPLSLIIYFFTVGTTKTHANVVGKQVGLSMGLLVAGLLLAIIGAIGGVMVWNHWAHLVEAMKGVSGAAAGATVAAFVVLIGLLLMYAGIDRRGYVPEGTQA